MMMNADQFFLFVNNKRVSLTAYLAMSPETVQTVDACGCTALTELAAPKAITVDASGCTALTELAAPEATTVYVSGCTALTELAAPEATTVYVSGCTALTELAAPKAITVDACGCTALTGYEHFYAGSDSRGYVFSAIKLHGSWRFIAGCRNFTREEALHHWGPGGRSNRPDCLALVHKLIAQIDA
jgi:hypothetical protein